MKQETAVLAYAAFIFEHDASKSHLNSSRRELRAQQQQNEYRIDDPERTQDLAVCMHRNRKYQEDKRHNQSHPEVPESERELDRMA
ncbi:MAG: hypothetical protein HS101_03715 [Planctomycetia bacterium]|nr:hypothetical protein [Planctomycetia bacterium]MCC7316028.1 hypothetical protein [Planctomycetota bacterium]